MKRALACAFVVALALAGHARPLDITVRSVSPHAGGSDGAVLSASPVTVGPAGASSRTVAMSIPGRVTLDLPEGVWRVQVKAAGWFHAGSIITVSKDGASNTVIPIWPLGTIHGKVATSDKATLAGLTARWGPSAKETDAVPEGEVPCAVTRNEYRCPVPAGSLDVKLGAKGYASHFLWALKVSPRADLDVPLIRLKRGAGVYGWVTVGANVSFDPSKTSARLIPASTAAASPQRPIVTSVDARGFFIFTGVDPGAYRISAFGPNSESEERDLVIRQSHESELLRPLSLERRASLRVTVTPPKDPSGLPWHLAISQARSPYGDAALLNQATGDATGVITVANLPPGTYEIAVSPKGKPTAYVARTIEMPRDSALAMDIRTVRLVGSVKMNERALAGAVIWIGGKFRSPAVTFTSGPDGEFEGFVPFDPAESWIVTVSHSTPSIEKTFNQRPERDADSTVRLDLALPAGMIEGSVTETDGSPATRGFVNVTRAGADADVMQARIAGDGRFELGGLDPGDYTVYAEGLGGRTSSKLLVSVAEDRASSVKLTFGNSWRLAVRLTTDDGTPISTAKVFVNSVEVPAPVWIPKTTSAGGEFVADLPEGTRTIDVLVIAPGFAFKTFRAPLETERQLVILLRQNGGRLDLTIPVSAMEGTSGRIPFVLHNGVAIPVMFLLSNRVATSTSNGTALLVTAPHVEPGAYGLCYATLAEASSLSQSMNCEFANLPAFGAAQMSIPAPAN